MNDILSVVYYDEKNLKVTVEFTRFENKEEQIAFINNLNSILGLFSVMPDDSFSLKSIH